MTISRVSQSLVVWSASGIVSSKRAKLILSANTPASAISVVNLRAYSNFSASAISIVNLCVHSNFSITFSNWLASSVRWEPPTRRPPEGGFGLTVWRYLEILAVLVVGMLGIVSSVELD